MGHGDKVCQAPGCRQPATQANHFACQRHWFILPYEYREALTRWSIELYNAGNIAWALARTNARDYWASMPRMLLDSHL